MFMKILAPATALMTFGMTSTVFAHGNLATQANAAISSALSSLQTTEDRTSLRGLKSVLAEVAGHEAFAVTVTFQDQRVVNYACKENEDVEPVVWECALTK